MSEHGEDRAAATLAQYDEIQTRLLAAYGAFEKVYDTQRPMPTRTRNNGLTLTTIITIVALIILVIAAMWVSGSRTIVEFMTVGYPAFVMLEVGSLVYAFRRAMNSEKQEAFSRDLVKAGLVICVVVMLAGNIDATLTEHGILIPPIAKTIIILAVAVSAPILTFIAGDILGIEVASIAKRQEAIEAAFLETLDRWRQEKENSWNSQKARWGANVRVEPIVISTPVQALSNGIPMENDGSDASKSLLGHKKQPNARKIVEAFFTENPTAVDGNPLEIAATLGVGKSTVYTVIAEIKKDAQR